MLLREVITVCRKNHTGAHEWRVRRDGAGINGASDGAAACFIFMASVNTAAVCATRLPIGGKAKRKP